MTRHGLVNIMKRQRFRPTAYHLLHSGPNRYVIFLLTVKILPLKIVKKQMCVLQENYEKGRSKQQLTG